MGQRRKGTIEVLAASAGLPTAIKVTFDEESANTGGTDGHLVPEFALAGKTVTVKRGEGGTITNDLHDPPDEATVAELNKLLEPDTSIYPKQPVAVGEEWDGDSTAIARQFQLGADDSVSLKCRLLSLNEIDGRKVANVSVAGQVSKREQGFVNTKTTLGGVSQIDLKTGELLASDVAGKISTKGSQKETGPDGKPVNIDVAADGTLEVHQTVKFPAAGAVVVESAPATAPVAAEPPAAGDAYGLAGSYQGGGMTVELVGDRVRYTGTLALGDKKFPLVAAADGNKLNGTFESEGAKFKFTALVDGAKMTLSSDGTTYTLTRTPANPLVRPSVENAPLK